MIVAIANLPWHFDLDLANEPASHRGWSIQHIVKGIRTKFKFFENNMTAKYTGADSFFAKALCLYVGAEHTVQKLRHEPFKHDVFPFLLIIMVDINYLLVGLCFVFQMFDE
jgi:hypothetical protein